MLEPSLSLFEIVSAIFAISCVITGGAVYYTRKTTSQTETHTNSSLHELKEALKENSKTVREDYKNLVTHIDDRIDRIYTRLDSNSTELKEYVSREVTSLKAKDYDQDIKIEHSKDKLHLLSEDLLKFKLEASEKYGFKQQ